MEENKPKWNVENLNIAILATDGKTFRKIAWLNTTSRGIYCMIGSTVGVGSKLSYHVDGNLLHGIYGIQKARNQLNYPPINEIKGLQPFYCAGIGWGDHLKEFPFNKIDEAVYVDIRPENKGVSFNLAFLEPDALQYLEYFSKFYKAHVHLITRTKPWIVIWTYEDGPKAQPSWMSEKKFILCQKCNHPLNITREPSNQSKMQHAHCDMCGYNITTEICQKCGKGLLVQLYDKKDPNSKEEPKRIVTREECRGVDGFGDGCGWKNEVKHS